MTKLVTTMTAALLGGALLSPAFAAEFKPISATMYKSPGCECCDGHAAALEQGGFNVKVVPIENMAAIKAKAGVPDNLQGCHTVLVGNYAVEGHVPVAAVKRLLAEEPSVRGIALPGMPAGSPGMGGTKTAPFRVMSFGDGDTMLFSSE